MNDEVVSGTSPHLQAIVDVATAHMKRDLGLFEQALKKYYKELKEDPVVSFHAQLLYDTLLENNLEKITEPYSRVEIAHVAQKIRLDTTVVQDRLAQMILDGKLSGTLDAGTGCLELFEKPNKGPVFEDSLKVISNMGKVVESLFQRTKGLAAAT